MKMFQQRKDVDTAGMAAGERFAIGFPRFYNIYKYHKFTNSYTWERIVNL